MSSNADRFCLNCQQFVAPKVTNRTSASGLIVGLLAFGLVSAIGWWIGHTNLSLVGIPIGFLGYSMGSRGQQTSIQSCPICGTKNFAADRSIDLEARPPIEIADSVPTDDG